MTRSYNITSLLSKAFLMISLNPFTPILSFSQYSEASEPFEILTSTESIEGALFGFSVSATENLICVGSPSDHNPNAEIRSSGAIYIFGLENGTWKEKQKIYPPTNQDGKNYSFGRKVYYNDSILIVSDYKFRKNKGHNSGIVYVYKLEMEGLFKLWKTIEPPQGASSVFGFGLTFSWTSDHLFVSAPFEKDLNGAVYVYEFTPDSIDLEQIITVNNPGIMFGYTLATSLDNAVISGGSANSCGFFVYEYSPKIKKWQPIDQIKCTETNKSDFGSDVAMYSNQIAISTNSSSKLVYLFSILGKKIHLDTILSFNTQIKSRSPSSLYFRDNILVVGMYDDKVQTDFETVKSGRVLLFQKASEVWFLKEVYTNPSAKENDKFGYSVVGTENEVIVSCRRCDPSHIVDAGVVYLFRN